MHKEVDVLEAQLKEHDAAGQCLLQVLVVGLHTAPGCLLPRTELTQLTTQVATPCGANGKFIIRLF